MGLEQEFNLMSDEDMLIFCKDADQETLRIAVSILARRHKASLLNHIYRMVWDREIAEDLLQEVFIRIYRKGREYRRIARVSTLLYKIATNLALNEIRNRRRYPHLSLNQPIETGGEGGEQIMKLLGTDDEAPARPIEQKDLGAFLQDILARLPEKYRVVIILCDIENFTYQEAAAVLDLPSGTIGSRLARGREYLARKLSAYRRQVRK